MLIVTQKDFLQLVEFVHKHFGIDLSKKKQLIEGRLNLPFANSGYETFGEYLNHVIHGSKDDLQDLINRLTTNHTYFMRENSHFDLFKNVILPDLERTRKNRVLGIWSAGCSSGEEPYTLSMILMDYFGGRSSEWDYRVLATDISERVLNIARAATYDSESVEDVPPDWKKKYFVKSGNNFILSKQVRDNVIFRPFNLMDPIKFKLKFDVIFCRNVMIYFDMPTKEALIHRFYDASVPGSYLMVGHSETLGKTNPYYSPISTAAYIRNNTPTFLSGR